MKQIISKVLHIIGHVLFACLKFTVQTMMKIDRYFWKRHLNVEMPLYKVWWNNHVRAMQIKLDKAHNINRKAAWS